MTRISAREATAWSFVTPSLLAIGVFFALPTIAAIFLSLTDFDIYAVADLRNLRFVGLQNYTSLFARPLFWHALGTTMWFVVFGVPATVIGSLAAAMLLNAKTLRWKPLWRLALFAPFVTTLVATAVVWRYLLHTRYGLINYALGSVGLAPVDWLGSPAAAIPAILIFIVWKTFGYNMIIFLTALQTTSADLYEAAAIDGAGWWTQFRHVTLPAIGPTLLLVSILSIAGFFQIFAEPYVMTLGGPAQSTVTVLYFMFEEGFKWWNLGSASAVAVILFVLILIVTLLQLRLTGERPRV